MVHDLVAHDARDFDGGRAEEQAAAARLEEEDEIRVARAQQDREFDPEFATRVASAITSSRTAGRTAPASSDGALFSS